jgi:hypothetical protein
MIIEALMNGKMPRAKIPSSDKPPPEKISKKLTTALFLTISVILGDQPLAMAGRCQV